jgi:hypothetical protein
VVLAIGNQDLWECAGPVDGDPSTVNSKRPELAGYAASLEVLLMLHVLSKDIYAEGTLKVTTWIDSSSAGKHLAKLLRGQLPKRNFPQDPDLLAHINWLWKELPHVKHSVKWVKAHQDNTQPVDQLPLSARLNVKADNLATQYYQAMMSKEVPWISHANPSPFPSCPVTLRVNGQVITAQSKAILRFHINGTRLRQHLQKSRKGWNDQVWSTIDFSGLGGALLSEPVIHRLKMSKLLHGWLNTGHQRKKMEPSANSKCPVCTQEDETQQHILQCPGSSMKVTRFNGLIKLRSHIVTKHGSSITWTTLHSALSDWLHQRPKSPLLAPNIQNNALIPILRQALAEQESIGWEYAFRGYLSSKWAVAQLQEHPRSTERGIRQHWLRSVIKELWTFHLAMWETRNKKLHENSASSQTIRFSTVDAQINRWYTLQHEFAVSDQRLFDLPLETRLGTSGTSKKHWLILVARYHATTATRQQGQQPLISTYFTRIHQHRRTSDIRRRVNLLHPQQLPDIRSHQQQRLDWSTTQPTT